ncbi:MAG TPA: AAA family ATPase [Capsulimonadaceae bacterium]
MTFEPSIRPFVDFVIITVREDEYRAVLSRFKPEGLYSGQNRTYAMSSLELPSGHTYSIAMIRCTEQGGQAGQAAASAAIQDLDLRWILLVGIAGAPPTMEYTLGDVVLGTRLYDLTVRALKQDAATTYDQRGGPMNIRVQDLVSQIEAMVVLEKFSGWNATDSIGCLRPKVDNKPSKRYGSRQWKRDVENTISHHFSGTVSRSAPLVTARGIVASDTLVKDTETLSEWQNSARHLGAVEMELHGVYYAVHNAPGDYPILAIRGISDIVGFRRSDEWTAYACNSAAAFAKALLLAEPLPPRVPATPDIDSDADEGTNGHENPAPGQRLIGKKHNMAADWLCEEWWRNGPNVTIIEGFPGVGKSLVAEIVEKRLKLSGTIAEAVWVDCIESSTNGFDDLILSMAQRFSEQGDDYLADNLSEDGLIASLAKPVLLVIDEFQRTLSESGAMQQKLSSLLNKICARPLQGRVLILSSQDITPERWSDRSKVIQLHGLDDGDASSYLTSLLDDSDLPKDAIPQDRIGSVARWLGGYPRAMRLLASRLKYDSMEVLVGSQPEEWETREQVVSKEFLQLFERNMLSRARIGLPDQVNTFFCRMAVFRKAVNQAGITAIMDGAGSISKQLESLISRFLIEQHRGRYSMHSVLRQTVLDELDCAQLKTAHRLAGLFYGRHFLAKTVVGEPGKLGADFLEARYHFTQADSYSDFAQIAASFEMHVLSTMTYWTESSSSQEEIDERICLLRALLQRPGAKALHFCLAKLLERRRSDGDLPLALHHARLGTGPKSPIEAWLLCVRLACSELDLQAGLESAMDGLRSLSSANVLSPLYLVAADILKRQEKLPQAVSLLKEGISRVPASALFSLYQSAGEILSSSGKASEAVELLKEGISRVPASALFSLYQSAGEILSSSGDDMAALQLLTEGVTRISATYNRYKITEQIILTACSGYLIEDLAAILRSNPEAFSVNRNYALAQMWAAKGNWQNALLEAEIRPKNIPNYTPQNTFFSLCQLACGDAPRAWETLSRFPNLRFSAHSPSTWLAAVIQVSLGDQTVAVDMLSKYLGGTTTVKSVEMLNLLKLWDTPRVIGSATRLSYWFPSLPPAVTGETETIRRRQYDPPILQIG